MHTQLNSPLAVCGVWRRHLRREAWRRDVPPYATPQELLDMDDYDLRGLLWRIKQALEHVHETGRLRPSDLQLPIYASPQYYKQILPGYEGGDFDPERLGAACIVAPPSKGLGAVTSSTHNPCSWNLKQVLTQSRRDCPFSLQYLHLVEQALARV